MNIACTSRNVAYIHGKGFPLDQVVAWTVGLSQYFIFVIKSFIIKVACDDPTHYLMTII